MSDRDERVAVFEDTLRMCEQDPVLAAAVAASKMRTAVFLEGDAPGIPPRRFEKTDVYVSKKRSFQAAVDLKKADPDARIAVLNFANAFRPGGGVVKGASAQEECLCRCSTLYPLLNRQSLKKAYYEMHGALGSSKATDAVIYTEGVVVFKTDEDLPKKMDRKDWVFLDVLTCAAPDLRDKANVYFGLSDGGLSMTDEELYQCHSKRMKHILNVAASKGADTLVLGAFGCGAFKNDPNVVARAWKDALPRFTGVFRTVEFAIYCSPGHGENYRVFCDTLG